MRLRSLVAMPKEMDFSDKTLLAANLLTITVAIGFGWSFLTIAWGFWLQSVIIGLFTVLKILLANPPHSEDFSKTITTRAPSGTIIIHPSMELAKIILAGFFVFHYGLFHFGYAQFLGIASLLAFGTNMIQPPNFGEVLIMGAIFFVTHLISFVYNYLIKNGRLSANVGQIFFAPYLRIVPMHITIVFGGFAAFFFGALSAAMGFSFAAIAERSVLALFLLLKTWVDLNSHKTLHAFGTESQKDVEKREELKN